MQNTTTIWPNDTTVDNHDLFLEITTKAAWCQNITFQYLHVKGHQDADKEHHLTIPEQKNVDCDQLAKQHICHPHFLVPPMIIWPLMLHNLSYALMAMSFVATLWQAYATPDDFAFDSIGL